MLIMKESNRNKALPYVGAFFLPVFVLLIVYMLLQIYPFGDKTLFTIDLNGQYISYLSYYKEILLGNESFLYTFSKNMGGDMIGLGAYYLMSPLNLIFLFFTTEMFPKAVLLLTLLKIGLSGVTMSIFLNQDSKWKESLLFSTAYALMAYNIVYQQNIMWLDGVILLPLVVLGIERIIMEQKPMLYIFSLSIAIITNYYIGFMICLFSLLYFFCFFIFMQKDAMVANRKKKSIRIVFCFIFSSLAAAGISSFVLVPALASLKGGKAIFSLASLAPSANYPFFDVLSKLYIGSTNFEQLMLGMPNIYCGMLVILCVVLYFLNKSISGRKKTGMGLLLLSLLVSFHLSTFNLIWHGFNSPVGFPYRYSFIFSFIMIVIACKGYQEAKYTLLKKNGAAIFAAIIIISMLVEKNQYIYVNALKIYVTISILFILFMLFGVYLKRHSKIASVFIVLVCLLDLGTNAYYSLNKLDYASYKDYIDYVTENKAVIGQIQSADSAFYRMEKTYLYNHNDAMLLDYYGLTHFSSTEKQFVKDFMGKMGFRNNGNWAYYNQGSTISVDSLFGVKYLLTKEPSIKPYEFLEKTGDILVYRNPYALPLGFMVNEAVTGVSMSDENLFALQNSIWRSMSTNSATPLFQTAQIDNMLQVNLAEEPCGNGVRYVKLNNNMDAYIEYKVNVSCTDPMYAYFPTQTMKQVEISLNDKILGTYFDTFNYGVISLGSFKTGEQITFTIKLNEEDVFINQALFYYENIAVLSNYYDDLASSEYRIDYFNGSSFEGEVVNTGDKKLMLFTIPYEKDWKIMIDGVQVESKRVFESLMAVEVPKGTHSLSLQYVPTGLYLGGFITIVSIGLLFGWNFVQRRKIRHL